MEVCLLSGKRWFMNGLALLVMAAPAFSQIEVYHKTVSVEVGKTYQFASYVPLSPNTVVWSVNGIVGGNATIGTVSSTGRYAAPAVAPVPSVLAVRATSTAFPDRFGEATVTVTRPTPWVWSVSPAPVPAGDFSIRLNGSNFTPDAQVRLNGMPLATTYVSSTSLRATGNAAAGAGSIAVYLPGPGQVTSQAVAVNFVSAALTVSPASASVVTGGTRAFTANMPVTWMASAGSISAAGVFTAPAMAGVVTVTAKSVADPTKVATATVTVTAPPLTITPSSASVAPGGVVSFAANAAVNWSASGGSITAAGVFTAPAMAGVVTVTAVSMGDATKMATAAVTVVAPAITLTPSSATVLTGSVTAFTASTAVTWQATAGTITAAGVFTAPSTAGAVTVTARSVADVTKTATAVVTVQLPVVSITPPSGTVGVGGTIGFSANAAVNWQVNGIAGGNGVVGTISAAGLYTAPAVVPTPATVTVRAVNASNAASFATASVLVTGPAPLVSRLTAGRLLEQAAFGGRPVDIAKVQQMGVAGWLDEQFALPETAIPDQASTASLRAWELNNFVHAPDQLRQRVRYSLGQIVVTSLGKLNYANEILPWLRVLQRNAFGNYRTLLREVTLSPSMGKYLDLANSTRPTAMSAANENYPREVMQLFSIGLWKLNNDGSQQLDGNGQPIPTYDQATVRQVALALTGWTYPTAPGGAAGALNWENFTADMEPRPAHHDTTAKAFLGCTLAANQTIQQDLDATIDCLFQHPNTPPFIATRLIRSLVKSNPSPAYIGRISAVFINNGQGVRGDLKAVVRAILTDAEARQDVPDATSGRMKEPIYFISAFVRAMNGSVALNTGMAYVYDSMGQSVLAPPSVFNWFSPMYRVPKSPLFGPEFQIYTPTEASLRANLVYQILTANGGDAVVDLTNFNAVAGNPTALLDEVDKVFFYGRMPAGVRTALTNAVTAAYDNNQRVQAAVYLAALSGQYAVQY
jgi:uncharacterized protein (DUF1800 family)